MGKPLRIGIAIDKKIVGGIFLVVLLFGFVSAETNVSVMYGHNGLGSHEFYLTHYESGTDQWRFWKDNSDNINVQKFTGGSADMGMVVASGLSASVWQHIAIVINGPEAGVYVNGTQIAYDGAWATDTFGPANFYVGISGGADNFLAGKMQDLHISYNNPYNATPNAGSTDSFTLPAAPFQGVME